MLKYLIFILAAPVITAIVCKVLEMAKKASPAELARAQAAAQATRQDVMSAAVAREALRQEAHPRQSA